MKTKITACTLACVYLLSGTANAQIRLPLNNSIRSATEKVLSAYPDRFVGIRGDSIDGGNNVVVYASRVQMEGALECSILKFDQSQPADYAWQAVLLKTDDYAAAVKKYNACYQQLKNIAVKRGNNSWKLEGSYNSPQEVKNFYSTILRPVGNDEFLEKLRVEILMQNDMVEWTISIMVYDRDREDWQGSMAR